MRGKKERERERVKRWTYSRDYVSECDCTSVLGSYLSVLESRHGPDMQFGHGPHCNLIPNLSLTAPVPRSGPQQVRSQTWHRIKPVPRSEPQQVRSRTWHRIQHVPRPGPNCSLVPGLDPIPTCPQTWTQFGHRPGSEIRTQRFY